MQEWASDREQNHTPVTFGGAQKPKEANDRDRDGLSQHPEEADSRDFRLTRLRKLVLWNPSQQHAKGTGCMHVLPCTAFSVESQTTFPVTPKAAHSTNPLSVPGRHSLSGIFGLQHYAAIPRWSKPTGGEVARQLSQLWKNPNPIEDGEASS